ncbi:hypothetical protein MY11210_008775 [Beauveria gryllotalpidicola]
MTMDSVKKSVASRIANSESTNIPSILHEGAHNHTQTITGTQSNTTDGASDKISAGSSAPDPVSSDSSLSMLEDAMKATKISTRSCLKSAQRSPGRDGNAKPTKRAAFVSDDALLTCLVTGAHTPPKAQTSERHEQFLDRSFEVLQQRKAAEEARRLARQAGNKGSDSGDDDDDDDDANNTYLLYTAREENCDDNESDPDGVEAKLLEDRLDEAVFGGQKLIVSAMSSGAFDFALYVTRDQGLLQNLEYTARIYNLVAKVASYRGDERRHVHGGGYAITQLPAEFYEDYRTAMSGVRRPEMILNMPVASQRQ